MVFAMVTAVMPSIEVDITCNTAPNAAARTHNQIQFQIIERGDLELGRSRIEQ